MPAFRDVQIGLTRFDREAFSLRRGIVGAVAIMGTLVFLAVVGYAGVAAVVGAAITAVAVGDGSTPSRLARGGAVAVFGFLLTFVGVWSGGNGVLAGAVVGLFTFVSVLASAYGKAAATAAFLTDLWLLVALGFSASDQHASALAGSFLVGGSLALVLQVLRGRSGGNPEAPSPEAGTVRPSAAPLRHALRADSELLQFALIRGITLGGATLAGWYMFDAHPYWGATVAFVIVKSDPAESVALAVHRTVGTVAGTVLGALLVANIDNRPELAAAFAVGAVLMIAVQPVNQAVYTFFLTVVLLLAIRLVNQRVDVAAGDRFWATLLGVSLALAVTALVLALGSRQGADGDRTI